MAGYVRTPIRRFLEVHREQYRPDVVVWKYESVEVPEKQPSRLTPIHPSEGAMAAKSKFRPCQAAGIFPIKPKKAGKSLLPVPVRTASSKKPTKNITSATRKGKSLIPVLANQHTIHAPRIEALKKRERELLLELMKTRADRERVEELHRKLLVQKPMTPITKSKRRSKSLALDDNPFNDTGSPNIGNMSPMLLSAGHSRNPGSIYENYRRTLKFLQTPCRSTFKQRVRPANLQNDNSSDVSFLVQSQLAHLFA